MDNPIQVFSNERFRVHGYLDANGTAWLKNIDVARGIGLVDYQEKVSATNGKKTYEIIRWARFNKYIAEIKARATSELIQSVTVPVDKNGYIPENLVYRLAMKATNEVAEKFQEFIADEVFPSLRKNGYYVSSKAMLNFADALSEVVDSADLDSADALSSVADVIPVEKKLEMLLKCAELATPGRLRNKFLNEAAELLTGKKF